MKILIVSLHVRHSPQAVALAAGNLRAALPKKLQRETRLIDFTLQQKTSDILASIIEEDADLIAFSLYLWNRKTVLLLARELKKLKRAPFILLGGPEASADSQRLLATGDIDAILRGEGEESFALLADALAEGKNGQGIPGLQFSPHEPVPAACSCEIDQLESPWLSGALAPVAGGVLWEVARGCPFYCSFCYDAKGMAGVRPLPMPRLTKELEHFARSGVEQVWVLDSTFNAPVQRGYQLLQLLAKTAPQLHYHLEAKAEFIDAKTIDLLSQISCSVQLGLQTTNDEVLAGLNRKINPTRFWAGVKLLANSGLTFGLDLIYGLPGDSHDGFLSSLDKTLGYRPNQIDIFPLAVLPGTELYKQKEQRQLIADDQPPYLVTESVDFTAQQLIACELLKASVDMFYNRGRAVGFLVPLCTALKTSPLRLLENFRDWFTNISCVEQDLLDTGAFEVQQIHQLQKSFLRQQFEIKNLTHLQPLVDDILEYHFHYAETLIDKEVLPHDMPPREDVPLKLTEAVHLVSFNCDILGALESEEIDLKRWAKQLDMTPTTGLMIRRGQQVLCESLTEEFYTLLQGAKKGLTMKQLRAELSSAIGDELLEFSWNEGLIRTS